MALGKLSAYFPLGIADLLISLVTAVFVMDAAQGSVLLPLFRAAFSFLALACVFVSAATRNQLAAYHWHADIVSPAFISGSSIP
jgi:hypothetical protein